MINHEAALGRRAPHLRRRARCSLEECVHGLRDARIGAHLEVEPRGCAALHVRTLSPTPSDTKNKVREPFFEDAEPSPRSRLRPQCPSGPRENSRPYRLDDIGRDLGERIPFALVISESIAWSPPSLPREDPSPVMLAAAVRWSRIFSPRRGLQRPPLLATCTSTSMPAALVGRAARPIGVTTKGWGVNAGISRKASFDRHSACPICFADQFHSPRKRPAIGGMCGEP